MPAGSAAGIAEMRPALALPAAALTAAALTAAGLALAACAGAAPTVTTDLSPGYRPVFVHYAAGLGPLPTAVRNNPFGAGAAADSAVAAAMERNAPAHLNALRFAPSADRSAYRVVLAFNPAATVGPQALCADPAAAGTATPPAGRLRATAALCAGTEWLSIARANGPAVSGPTDGQFETFLGAMLSELMPPKTPFSDKCAGGC